MHRKKAKPNYSIQLRGGGGSLTQFNLQELDTWIVTSFHCSEGLFMQIQENNFPILFENSRRANFISGAVGDDNHPELAPILKDEDKGCTVD